MRPVQVTFVEHRYPRRREATWFWSLISAMPLLLLGAPLLYGGAGLLGALLLLGGAVGVRLWRGTGETRSGPSPVVVHRRFLSLPSEFVPLDDIRSAFVVPPGPGESEEGSVVLDLVDGSDVVLGMPREAAEALLDDLRLRRDQRVVRVPLQAYSFLRSWMLFIAAAGGMGLLLEGGHVAAKLGIAALVALVVGPMLWMVLPRLVRRASANLVAGSDGLRMHRVGVRNRDHVVPYAEVQSLETTAGKLVVHRRRQTPLRLAMARVSEEHVRGLRFRIEQTALVDRGGERIERRLARGDRSIAEWRAFLGALTEGGADFRQVSYGAEELARILESGGSSTEARVGAAVALRACDPEGVAKIRVAASETIDDDLRAALDAIAEDEPAEAAMERALRVRP